MIPKVYSVPEAAELLRVSEWTIWKWLQTGKLQGSKIGGDRRVIRESELARLIVDDPRPTATGARKVTPAEARP
jgi:excisionase family DNA binding protein